MEAAKTWSQPRRSAAKTLQRRYRGKGREERFCKPLNFVRLVLTNPPTRGLCRLTLPRLCPCRLLLHRLALHPHRPAVGVQWAAPWSSPNPIKSPHESQQPGAAESQYRKNRLAHSLPADMTVPSIYLLRSYSCHCSPLPFPSSPIPRLSAHPSTPQPLLFPFAFFTHVARSQTKGETLGRVRHAVLASFRPSGACTNRTRTCRRSGGGHH